ncbi:MAG TPA: hypothetical protein VLU25_17830 [Acidobacteriota bacterium]|nr:hypothetical protein [Acidobacteriota bacterium]
MLTLYMGTAVAGDCEVIFSEYIGCCYGGYYGQYLHHCADGSLEIVCYGPCQGPPP